MTLEAESEAVETNGGNIVCVLQPDCVQGVCNQRECEKVVISESCWHFIGCLR